MFTYYGKPIGRVGFLGFGKSNRGIYEYVTRRGAPEVTLRVSDGKIPSDIPGAKIYTGKNTLSDIDEDILFLSPSARRDTRELCEAAERGVILSSDAELFFSLSEADIYAVTGSDGKSSTTYLTSRLLTESYPTAIPCGNFGEAMTPHLDDPAGTAFVTELSSFQLMNFKPRSKRCVITNVTPNHLNWHRSISEYAEAKRNILDNSRERIVNFDCEMTRELSRDYELFAVLSRRHSESELRRLVRAEVYITEEGGLIRESGRELLHTSSIRVGGGYNISNFMAAAALAYGKYEKNTLVGLAESFGGLPHRFELVLESGGVRYYDSSIDSSPKRCKATLAMTDGRVILILGGRSKGLDFGELIPSLIEKTKLVILTGECGGEIEEALRGSADFRESGISYTKIEDFSDAVEYAKSVATAGDTVLLSPAATSFDRFSSFEERGDAFQRAVKS